MHPDIFLELPDAREYSAQICEAHDIITNSYNAVSDLLLHESVDHVRLCIHADRLSAQIVPLLEALERDMQNNEWIEEAATAIFSLINDYHCTG